MPSTNEGQTGFEAAKGAWEYLSERLGVEAELKKAESPVCNAGKTLGIFLGGEMAGMFGEASPEILASYDIYSRPAVLELNLEKLLAAPRKR